jgi:hypothetical protein
MSNEPEVHFCNVCNQSIPESALHRGCAVRVEGRIVPLATPEAAQRGEGPPMRSPGVWGWTLVVLAAIAGAAFALDARLGEVERGLRADLAAMSAPVQQQTDLLGEIDRRVAAAVQSGDLAPLGEAVADAREILRADVKELGAAVAAGDPQWGDAREALRRLEDALVQHGARLTLVQDEVRALTRDVAAWAARPAPAVGTPSVGGRLNGQDFGDGAAPAGQPDMGVGALPPEIAHHAARLTDGDDGVRFEAVDQLLQTKDERVYPLLLPLAMDPDLFVRRFVLEGLAEHRSAASVDALLTALADPEEVVRHTAYLGLQRLTGQTIVFDPGASSDQRSAAQRRWRQWWEKNRAGF